MSAVAFVMGQFGSGTVGVARIGAAAGSGDAGGLVGAGGGMGAGVGVGVGTGTFCDGMLLSALLDRLERLLDHTLEGNLVLTGTLAKLAQWPDPLLHMALFDERPRADYYAGGAGGGTGGGGAVRPFPRSMRRVLVEVWVDARKRIERIGAFEDKLVAMRKELGVDKVQPVGGGEKGKHEAPLARGGR